ncbi:hypothetical protein B0I37DRAFT_411053 [Chaetomium sp. MPI-CAGE-AT-0009]|nr:hypothetical protein B0I37DRAFT_411053 [Chaetomium sp. MPI-CAGE-AT-0009]
MVQLTSSMIAVALSLSTLSAAARHSTEKTYKPSSWGYFEDCEEYSGKDLNPAPIITDEDGFLRYLVKRDIPQSNCNYPIKAYEPRNGRLVFVGYKYPNWGVRCKWPRTNYRYCLWHTMLDDHKVTTARTCDVIAKEVGATAEQIKEWNPWVGEDCDSGLYADIHSWIPRAVCAGVKGFIPKESQGGDAHGGADL